jgi:hypothetical protein
MLSRLTIVCALSSLLALPALAQSPNTDTYFYTPGGGGVNGSMGMCLNAANKAVPCNAAGALPTPVTGTFSATLSGFTPGGTFATLTATAASASVALPAGTTVAFQNTGTTTVSCTLGVGSATAAANQIQVAASSTVFVTPGSNTFGACIDQTGSASNLVVLAGGSGLGTGFGGGGGGGSLTGSTSNASSAVATSSTNLPTVSYNYGFNGTTWDQLQVDGSKNLKVNVVTGGGSGLSVTDQAAFTQGTSAFAPDGGVFNDAATLSSGQQGMVRLTTKRAQLVDVDPSGSQLHADMIAPTPAGTNTIGAVTGPSAALLATAANQATNAATTTHTCSTAGYSELGCLGQIDDDIKGPIPTGTNSIGTVQPGNTPNTVPWLVNQNDGTNSAVVDPCQSGAKVYTPINVVTATNIIITGVAAKKKYICGMFLYPAGTDNIAIYQATTATSCATAAVGVIGGTTTATGINATAQAGFVLPTTGYAHAATTVNQTDLCITTSAAVQLSGVVVTVDR